MTSFFAHPDARVETDAVGDGTRVWAFAHVLSGARLGADVNVCDHVFVEGDVVVGDRVTIKSGVQLWDGMRVGDDVFIGPNASFVNDRFPRSKQYPERFLQTELQDNCSVGAGAVVLGGVTVGRGAMVGAGAVVTRDVPPNAIVTGNPAVISGYVGADRQPAASTHVPGDADLGVGGARVIDLPLVEDLRGRLTFGEIEAELPFVVKRFFLVHGVRTSRIRGEHSHRTLEQFLVCVAGSVSVMVDDGEHRADVRLDSSERGVYIPPMVWGTQYDYSADAVLLVLASDCYDADEYIRDYDEFLRLRAG